LPYLNIAVQPPRNDTLTFPPGRRKRWKCCSDDWRLVSVSKQLLADLSKEVITPTPLRQSKQCSCLHDYTQHFERLVTVMPLRQ